VAYCFILRTRDSCFEVGISFILLDQFTGLENTSRHVVCVNPRANVTT
jgi:hypothetical protein